MGKSQGHFLYPVPQKSWEYESFYIDLFLPVDLYHSHGNVVS